MNQPYSDSDELLMQWWPVSLADGRLLVLRRLIAVPAGTEPTAEMAAQVGRYLQGWQAATPGS